MFGSIKAKFMLNLFASIVAIVVSVVLSYFISIMEVKNIMRSDIDSVADTVSNMIDFYAKKNPQGFNDPDFKKAIYDMKIGQTGYVYIVDASGTFIVHHKQEGKNFKGHDYVDYITAHKEGGVYEYVSAATGQEKIASFRYVKEWNAWVVPGVNKGDYFDNLKKEFLKWNLLLGAVLSILLLAINYSTGRSILGSIFHIDSVAKDLAHGDGDLTARLPSSGKDEISQTSRFINQFIEKIQKTVGAVLSTAHDTAGFSKMTLNNAKVLSEATHSQAVMVQESKDIVTKVENEIDISEELSIHTTQNTQNNFAVLEQMSEALDHVVEEIAKASRVEVEMSGKIDSLASQTNQIKSVLEIIRDIADQTNLLALNAAIEAARAGDQGRGFAVVADEVRKLAERTQRSLAEIDATIGSVVQSVEEVSQEMSINADSISEISGKAQSVKNKTDETKLNVQNTILISKKASHTAVEIAHTMKTLIAKMDTTMSTALANQKIADDLIGIANALSGSSEKLNSELKGFKI